MEAAKLRAWWAHRQALDGRLEGRSAAEVLAQTGWARSVGGAAPYLTLFARAGLSRQTVDDALASMEIQELPAARGCTYVVPAADYALALKVGQGFNDEADMKTVRKLGVADAEIDRLCTALLDALAHGPRGPEELRTAAGAAARDLGPEGKKRGLSSTVPVALSRLQSAGEVRRIPINGRIDQQRYRYALWRPNPLTGFRLSREDAFAELARRYFNWIAPASAAEFQWFSGLGAKAARTAFAEAGGEAQPPSLAAFQPPAQPHYTLVSSLDNILHLRRDARALVAEADLDRPLFASGLTDLASHAIIDRGRLVGLWEFDPAAGSIAWAALTRRDAALEQAVLRSEAFVRDQLGDARSFSLDSPKSRAPRLEALRRKPGA